MQSMDLMGLSLSDEHLVHVHGLTAARKMWVSLIKIYEKHKFLNKLNGRTNLYTVRLAERESILFFINGAQTLDLTLQNMGVVLY